MDGDGAGESEGVHGGVDGVEAEVVPEEVGGGVVADGDGEGGEVAQGEAGGVAHDGEAGGAGGAPACGDVEGVVGSMRPAAASR